MALLNFHCFHFVLPPIRVFSNQDVSILSPSPFPSATCSSPSFHLRCANAISKKSNRRRAPNPIRASSEGIPSEVVEDSKFVPLNADDPIYGPLALLLLGFGADETDKIQMLLKELDGEFLKVIHCTEDMMKQTVWNAMHTEQSNAEDVKIAKSLPRVCLLSGLTDEEMMMFIDAYPETGLKPAVFAALVPNSANKLLADVVEEIMGDHEMLVEELFSLENNGTNVEARLVNRQLFKALKGTSFHVLDITCMSEFRADAHPSTTGGKKHVDCMDWCLRGLTNTWNDLFAALLDSL